MENEKNLEEVQEEVLTSEETTPVEEMPAAEAAAPEEAAPAEEVAPAEETAAAEEAAPAEEAKKVTPGKLAMVIAAIVVVLAVIVALLMGGKTEPAAEMPDATAPTAEATEPEATIPADGNPNDETCKGSYSVSDEEARAAMDTVVATIGAHELTNGQLNVFYWMQVQNFLSSEYGSYMQYYGALDYTKPFDTQISVMEQNRTWQQFFLKEALNSWRSYCALEDQAELSQMEIAEENIALLDALEENLQATAKQYGLESVEELLRHNIGPGADLEDYKYFQELLMKGNLYYDAEYTKLTTTDEELETYFAEHEEQYAESGITRDGVFVDVRHVLFTPEGGTTGEDGTVTYSEEEWAACEAKAQDALNSWNLNGGTEEEFAKMAMTMSQDPGSQSTGGLYENVYEGQMVPEFNDWCFDESREYGHNGIVKTTYGYHLMYFVDRTPMWKQYAQEDLMTQKTSDMMESIVADYPMEVSYGDIVLGYVNLSA